MPTPDPDLDDAALARLGHHELSAILASLYARLGEAPLTASSVRASTADELRSRLRAVRHRLAWRVEPAGGPGPGPGRPAGVAGPPGAGPRPGTGSGPRPDAPEPDPGPGAPPLVPRRRIVVVVTVDDSLVEQARQLGRGLGLVVVRADSAADLRILIASVTPACVLLDERGPPIDAAVRQELLRRALPLRVGASAEECLANVAESWK